MARNGKTAAPTEPTLEELEAALAITATTGDGLEKVSREMGDVFYRVAKALEIKMSLRDQAKSDLEEEEARCDLDIRDLFEKQVEVAERLAEKTKEKKTLPKQTEGQIRAQIVTDPDVKKARARYQQLKLEAGLYSALKESFQQRSYAMNHLVDIFLQRNIAEAGITRREDDQRALIDTGRRPLQHSKDKR